MTQATQPGPLPSDDERARRQKTIDYARGSVRLDGFVLNEEAEALLARDVNGEMNRPELAAAVAKLATSYG
jgi:hypothetical protein